MQRTFRIVYLVSYDGKFLSQFHFQKEIVVNLVEFISFILNVYMELFRITARFPP